MGLNLNDLTFNIFCAKFEIMSLESALTRPIDYSTNLSFQEVNQEKIDLVVAEFYQTIDLIKYDSFWYFLHLLQNNLQLSAVDYRKENPQTHNNSNGTCVDLAIFLQGNLSKIGLQANILRMVDIQKTDGKLSEHIALSVPIHLLGHNKFLILDERTGIFLVNETGQVEILKQFYDQSTKIYKLSESFAIETQKGEETRISEFNPQQNYLYPHNHLMKKTLLYTKYLLYRDRNKEGQNMCYLIFDLKTKPYKIKIKAMEEKLEIVIDSQTNLSKYLQDNPVFDALSFNLGIEQTKILTNLQTIINNIGKLEAFWKINKI